MKTIGNVIWFIFGGLEAALAYCIAGLLFCVTVIGIPFGMQCFKLAGVMMWPFGKQIVYGGGGGSFLANIVWFLLFGLWMAIGFAMLGVLYCITVIGIPFGTQCFKLAGLSLRPFGAEVI